MKKGIILFLLLCCSFLAFSSSRKYYVYKDNIIQGYTNWEKFYSDLEQYCKFYDKFAIYTRRLSSQSGKDELELISDSTGYTFSFVSVSDNITIYFYIPVWNTIPYGAIVFNDCDRAIAHWNLMMDEFGGETKDN